MENHCVEESRGQRGRETWDLGLDLTWFQRRWRGKRRSRRKRTTTPIRRVCLQVLRVDSESATESPLKRSPHSLSFVLLLLLLLNFLFVLWSLRPLPATVQLMHLVTTSSDTWRNHGPFRLDVWIRWILLSRGQWRGRYCDSVSFLVNPSRPIPEPILQEFRLPWLC